jgi:hypothetical protein
MTQRYEYKFVRLGEAWWGGPSAEARCGYQAEIERHARDGWRLVQIFAPAISGYGSAKYYELVLERPV